jgi:hypothetical protein
MPETGLTIVATTYPDIRYHFGNRYGNVFGLASLIFTIIRSQGKQRRRNINFRHCDKGCVTNIISVTNIKLINNITHVTSDAFIV